MGMEQKSQEVQKVALMMSNKLLKEVKAYATDKASADIDFIRSWADFSLVRSFLTEAEKAEVDKVKNEIWEAVISSIIRTCRQGVD